MISSLLATATLDSFISSLHGLFPSGIIALGDAAVRALLVAGVVGAGLRVFAARHVPAQKAAWGLVLGGTLLMPILAPWAGSAAWIPSGATWVIPTDSWGQYFLSRVGSLQPTAQPLETERATRALRALRAAQPFVGTVVSAPSEPSQAATSPTARFQIATVANAQPPEAEGTKPAPRRSYYLPTADLVWMIYGAICLALLLRLAYGLGGAIGLWQSAGPVVIDPRLAGGLRLRSSPRITSPVTIGSAVVLPDGYEEWDTEKLRIVLAHERSHVRQGDFYLQALAGLYTALFWFSPLGWWLRRKLSDLSETISDHAGLEQAASHASYARILLEFAALPRRAQVGVAMARTGGLSHRIERLLNENTFRQAFTGGRRRLLAALLLVPISLFAATALIRVQAAQTLKHPVSDQGPVIAQSHPEAAPAPTPQAQPDAVPADPAPEAEPAQAPPAEDADEAQEPATPPNPATAPPAAPALAPAAPTPPSDSDENQDQSTTTTNACSGRSSSMSVSRGKGYTYSYSSDGDSYALVNGKDMHGRFSGEWHNSEIDKARAMAHGNDFLWFSHGDKSFVVDDPQTIAHIQAMYRPMEDLGRRQRELGEQQRQLGDQQRELGRRQRDASVPPPDLSKEMSDLNASIGRLQSKGSAITGEQLGEIQREIGELQSKLGRLNGEIGTRQGELGRRQGELGKQQGELGRQQGELGREQGRLARETDTKVHSIIDQTLKDGRARPVQ